MVAGRHNFVRGYKPGSYGSLNPDTYKGIKITKFISDGFSSRKTYLYFESTNNVPNPLKIKINDTVYNFTKDGDRCIYNGDVFTSGSTYTIEFLN